ncbi:hypothetical protein JTB14_030557 [Gonioctena quinquepunctata]|nr:hypothetical protein JTB14_030557 [Gonioctena quinquepunctata]
MLFSGPCGFKLVLHSVSFCQCLQKQSTCSVYKMATKTVLCCFVIICVIVASGLDPNCPLSSSMTSCSPKCKGDSECFGRKCCPNICNTKSCVPANLKDSQNGGYKNQNTKSAVGSYCGNVKCNSFEKCELDRTTKRQKCVRA